MYNTGRKRLVSSCIPCYTKKQKCNREYPCNHCSRRRRPEECAYHANHASQSVAVPPTRAQSIHSKHSEEEQSECASQSAASSTDWSTQRSPASVSLSNASTSVTLGSSRPSSDSLSDLFGYAEDSESNTLAVIRKGWIDEQSPHSQDPLISPDAVDDVQRIIERLPDRQILEFLIRYFVAEVNWVDQLIHPPWLLGHYQRWRTVKHLNRVHDVEFAILVLRICFHASLQLPSRSYTLDKVRGVPLTDIRSTCDDIASRLSAICSEADSRGSLFRVQHWTFLALSRQHEGRTDKFWESFTQAVRASRCLHAQGATVPLRDGVNQFDKEMQRRTFCSLYAWESLLSRQLDCGSMFACRLRSEDMPQMHLVTGSQTNLESGAPDDFTERLLEARLSDFWKTIGPSTQDVKYDMMAAEERYEKFCTNFLPMLPSTFALTPDKTWDERLVKLPLQRQLLHIAIYDSICWNFRPLLQNGPTDVQALPAYKQVLVASQRTALAAAALQTLEGVDTLHTMLGGCHARLPQLVFYTFEAAVILTHLCRDTQFPDTNADGSRLHFFGKSNPLPTKPLELTRNQCLQALQDALGRLNMLADVSNIAGAGARTLSRLIRETTGQDGPIKDATLNWFDTEVSDARTIEEFICSMTVPQDIHRDWDQLAMDFQMGH